MSRLMKRDSGQSQEIPQAMIEQASKVPEKRLNVRLDGHKYQQFYDLCFQHRKSMKEVIEAHIDECLKRGTL